MPKYLNKHFVKQMWITAQTKMLSIVSHEGNAEHGHSEIPSQVYQKG